MILFAPGDLIVSKKTTPAKANVGRRRFLQASAGAAAVLSLASGVHADGPNILRIGLIGCGGRGTGAAGKAPNPRPKPQSRAIGGSFPPAPQNNHAPRRRNPSPRAPH